jgi:hypothetical protein
MFKPTQPILKSILVLQGSPDYKIVKKWLDDCYKTNLEDCSISEDSLKTARLQGRSLELAELINILDKTKDTLDRFADSARHG